MDREEAKNLFRGDRDSYGKPRGIMKKLNKIYDDFEKESLELRKEITELKLQKK